ncbi:hypothetical protein IWW39_000421 [Coemansia spiralis]|uniref:Uncharacterized protein n=1 Tax=Coemansia spiralis TaxID=417178 RepID=A0A9W8GSA8_9FUNG|nr:hypothetical protein IWW39_000421 [Coemansia spiralis]
MFTNGAENPAVRAKQLIDNAKQALVLDQQDYVELQRIMEHLLQDIFSSFSTPGSAGGAEAGLYLVSELLSSPSVTRLYECGIRSAALTLGAMPAAIANISSQGGNETASIFSSQIADVCLSKLAKAVDELGRQLEKSVAASGSGDLASLVELLQLATVSAECTADAIERLSGAGDDGLLRSPAIWRSALDGTSAVALHVFKMYEGGCRFHALCANSVLRRQTQCGQLYKASERLIMLSSAVFGSRAHLKLDSGMKRSLLLRYCERTLAVHRAMLNSAPLFKAVWQSLCAIVTGFPAGVSFDAPGLCLKVYLKSCDVVGLLAAQQVAVVRQAKPSEMRDQKAEQRVNRTMAFIRFIVFQMPSLLARIGATEPAGSNSAMTTALFAAVDLVAGELACGQTLCRLSPKMSALIRQVVDAFIAKALLSLLAHYVAPITDYLDSLLAFVDGGNQRTSQIPLLPGLKHVEASREVLLIVATGIDAFTADQQQMLLTRGTGLIRAIALTIDRDIVSVLPYAMADANHVCDEQMSLATDAEKLVQAVALCATRIASPAHFGFWETGALAAIVHSPRCSLGAWVVAEAWIVLAKHALTGELVLSTVTGIVEALVSKQSADLGQNTVVRRLVSGMVATRSDVERERLLSGIVTRFLRPNDPLRAASACALAPWTVLNTSAVAVQSTISTAARQMVALLGKGALGQNATAFAALAALAPAIAAGRKTADHQGLISDICTGACTALEQCCAAPESDADSGRVAEGLLSAVSRLGIGDTPYARRLLELCAKNLGCSALAGPEAMFQLSEFIGAFVTVDLERPSAAMTVRLMGRITAHLLDAQRPWIVRHAAHLLIVRFAAESVSSSVIESLVPQCMQASLVGFIQRVPAGTPFDGDDAGDRRRAVYRSVFDRPLPFGAPRGDGVGGLSLAEAIRALCARIDGAASEVAEVAVQNELARLAQTIERVRRPGEQK